MGLFLFQEEVPEAFVEAVFHTMNRADWHQYQILTKRPERLLEMDLRLPWREHIWMGVSVESSCYTGRIDSLLLSILPITRLTGFRGVLSIK